MTAYESELAKTRKDIAALELISGRNPLDPEKRIRLAYRQYHQASLSNNESDFKTVKQAIAEIIRDFGPKEDICLLKANIDGHFHCLAEVKKDLEMCPSLARRFAGRSILADIDLQEGRYDQGFQALEELIQENRTWDNLARLAHWKGKMGHVAEADRLLEEAGQELTAKELRSFAWIEVQRGSLMMSRGQYDTARLHFERAAKTYPGHWHTEEHLAGFMAAKG